MRARTPQPSHGDHSDHDETAHGPWSWAGSGSYSDGALVNINVEVHVRVHVGVMQSVCEACGIKNVSLCLFNEVGKTVWSMWASV